MNIHQDINATTLDGVIDTLPRDQVLKIAHKFSGDKFTAVAPARQRIVKIMNTPKLVDALVGILSPSELQMLGEVKRRGGSMDGWALYTFARLRELKPTVSLPRVVSIYSDRNEGANFPGAELIWGLIADGLLLPYVLPNPWVRSRYERFYLGYERSRNPRYTWVKGDQRLLSRLPDAVAAPIKLKITTGPVTQTAAPPTPVLLLLQLMEILRGLRVLGGLALTQSLEPNQAALKRLAKLLPAISNIEYWLLLGYRSGLIRLNQQQRIWEPDELMFRANVQFDPAGLLASLQAQLLQMDTPEDEEWLLQQPKALQGVLLHLLSEVQPAVTLRELLRVLEVVAPLDLRQPRYQGKADNWQNWTRAILRGTLQTLGLVQVVGEGDAALVIPNPAAGTAPQWAQGASVAWVLQPNFELLVYPAQLGPQHLPILQAAEAVRFDAQTATYRLTRESVYAALETGLTLEELLAGLQAGSATPLAASVGRTMQDWAARRERLTLHQGITLMEYPSGKERDTALAKAGGTAVGATLLIVPEGKKVQPGISLLKYDGPRNKTLKFSADGTFTVTGELDFLTRQLLANHTERAGKGKYKVKKAAPGTLPTSFLTDLESRSVGRLPGTLRLQLGVWSGTTPPPSVAPLTLIQHPQAQALTQHPDLKDLIGAALGPQLFTVLPGQEKALEKALAALGLHPNRQINPPETSTNDLIFLADTRKKREFIEEAIKQGQNLLIQYQEEKFVGWYGKSQPGKRRQEEVQPLSIDRGSTPYLNVKELKTGEKDRIRIQYILGMAVR